LRCLLGMLLPGLFGPRLRLILSVDRSRPNLKENRLIETQRLEALKGTVRKKRNNGPIFMLSVFRSNEL